MEKNLNFTEPHVVGRKEIKMIRRLSTEAQRQSVQEEKKFKTVDAKTISDKELKELVILIAKKLGII